EAEFGALYDWVQLKHDYTLTEYNDALTKLERKIHRLSAGKDTDVLFQKPILEFKEIEPGSRTLRADFGEDYINIYHRPDNYFVVMPSLSLINELESLNIPLKTRVFKTLAEAKKQTRIIYTKFTKKADIQPQERREILFKQLTKKRQTGIYKEWTDQSFGRAQAIDLAQEMESDYTIEKRHVRMTKNGTLYIKAGPVKIRIADHYQPEYFAEPVETLSQSYDKEIEVVVEKLETLEDYNNAISIAEQRLNKNILRQETRGKIEFGPE
ncbi:unnamed protein product, partial [marine sediment metagenome]